MYWPAFNKNVMTSDSKREALGQGTVVRPPNDPRNMIEKVEFFKSIYWPEIFFRDA